MTEISPTPRVIVAVADGIATVTLDSPPVNALSPEMYQGLRMIFDRLSDIDEVRVAILAAAGKVFCAGVDLKARNAAVTGPGDGWDFLRAARETFYAIRECKKPVIAALGGTALGAGFGLVAHCDIMLVSENASIGLPEIDVGLMGGGTVVQRLFSPSTARRMALMGYRMPAAEMYRLGIAEACLPADQLMPTAMEYARALAAKSPLAIRIAKETLNTIEEMPARESYRFEQSRTAEMAKSDDAKEAVRAFMDKRAPVFTGR